MRFILFCSVCVCLIVYVCVCVYKYTHIRIYIHIHPSLTAKHTFHLRHKMSCAGAAGKVFQLVSL